MEFLLGIKLRATIAVLCNNSCLLHIKATCIYLRLGGDDVACCEKKSFLLSDILIVNGSSSEVRPGYLPINSVEDLDRLYIPGKKI